MSKLKVNRLIRFGIVRSKKNISKTAEEIKKNKLYVSGWSFQQWLQDQDNIKQIVTCRDKGKLVAVGIRYDNVECMPNSGIFVKPKYREQGIGSKILKKLPVKGMPLRIASGIYSSLGWYMRSKKKMKFELLW